MSGVIGFPNGNNADNIGEWQQGVIRRTLPDRMSSIQELRAKWRGSSKRRKCKAKLSPKQSAKRRWKKVRNQRRDVLLMSREYIRQSPLLHWMLNENRGVKQTPGEFTWWERTPVDSCSPKTYPLVP